MRSDRCSRFPTRRNILRTRYQSPDCAAHHRAGASIAAFGCRCGTDNDVPHADIETAAVSSCHGLAVAALQMLSLWLHQEVYSGCGNASLVPCPKESPVLRAVWDLMDKKVAMPAVHMLPALGTPLGFVQRWFTRF